jgi:molybdopterin-binding protein
MIRLDGVSLALGGFRLGDVSFEVAPGGYGLVIGPTGAGKTTLLEAIAGHVPITSGRIELDGRDVTNDPPERRGIGFVYQAYHLFPHFSVRQNIAYGLERSGIRGAEADGRVTRLAQLLGLVPLLERGVRGLSGGEQQRVALARALAPRPRILLLDEPLAAVDPSLRRALRQELQLLREAEGVTTLHVTHDIEDALRLGDVLAVLVEGRVIQVGPPEDVFHYPRTPFVAQFVGSGNVLEGLVQRAGPDDGDPPRFPGRFSTDALTFEVVAEREGKMHALLRPEDLLVSRAELPGYPRNRFAGRVTRLERVGPITNVILEVEGTALTASITTQTAQEQGLRPGDQVAVGWKATAVHLL